VRESSNPSPAITALFASILERTQRPLRGFICGLVDSAEQASDIVQDVFVDAWRTAQNAKPPFDGNGDEQAIRRWLFHVAYRRAAASWRHDHVLRFESLEGTPAHELARFYELASFEDRIAEGELLDRALAELGPQDAACLLLNVVQGFTSIEIADILDITPVAAKKRLARAKHRLRDAYFNESKARVTEMRL
jgi:RNA polymerase sigma-70 factor (ECF subfamily)